MYKKNLRQGLESQKIRGEHGTEYAPENFNLEEVKT